MTPKLETVAAMWDSYRRIVLDADAPAIQVSECRLAFYGGVHALLLIALNGIGDDSVSEDQGVAYLERLHQELLEFNRQVGAVGVRH